ncbi:Ku protein [Verrucomicrobia bacterium SCGC AG-212-E04]|nr:Ku protein [Verrucomicrobia bacterium SCGC AG-212-E04]
MRAIWKGAISFGLVNIPIALYPATRREQLKFRLLRASDLSPVNYKRVAEADGREVPWDQIVKGYEHKKGKFVVLRDEDFARVDVEATQTVDITDFVELTEVNPMFFSKPYWMEPQKSGAKAYALLRDALADSGKIGIAKVVIKTRQYLAGVKAQDDLLVLELMHFADELIDTKRMHVAEVSPGKKELAMARTLIGNMTTKWNPARYSDEYREAVEKVIQAKLRHPQKASGKKPAPPKSSKIIDLVAVLQQSLSKKQTKSAKSRPTRKPKAA